jgi:hypothetical protein
MLRWLAVVGACVLAGTTGLLADQNRGSGNGGARQQELQSARQTMQLHVTELKRLQAQLKIDRKSRDQNAIQRDQDGIKMTQVLIRQDQDRIRQLLSDRPNRGNRGDGSGNESGRGGRGR